jgi:CBS domain-containing protein
MKFAKDILHAKGHAVWSIDPDSTVLDALKLMAEKEVGAIVVMRGEKLRGLISERDYARKIVLEGKTSRDSQVKDVMTRRVLCAAPERTIEECLALMTDKRERHLPIVEKKHVIGMVSIGDLVKAVIAEQQFEIERLQQYIDGDNGD